MKKAIFLIGMLFALFFAAEAQRASYQWITNDTLTNADTIITSTLAPSRIYYGSIQVVADSLTGNPNGSAVLQESNDGTTWSAVSGKSLTLNGSGTYTAMWALTPFTGRYYRVYILGAGTATVKVNIYRTLYYTE